MTANRDLTNERWNPCDRAEQSVGLGCGGCLERFCGPAGGRFSEPA